MVNQRQLGVAFLVYLCVVCWGVVAGGEPVAGVVRVGLSAEAAGPVSGRLLICLIEEGKEGLAGVDPLGGPLWASRQPMLAMEITGLAPGETRVLEAGKFACLNVGSVGELKGKYRVAARLIGAKEATRSSRWRGDAGNWYTGVQVAEFGAGAGDIMLLLDQKTVRAEWPRAQADELQVEEVRVVSALLSKFYGREVVMEAAVIVPRGFDGKRKYGTVYEVPGFGGTHADALGRARRRINKPVGGAEEGTWEVGQARLDEEAYWVVLNPESSNGHTLFADSANNGPRGEALVREMIPAIERAYPAMAATRDGRLLRGHSSGGWATVWLATAYPETFGGAWATSPDPVDFRRFQLIDLYGQRSMFTLQRADNAWNNLLAGSGFVPVVLEDWGRSVVQVGGRPEVVALGSFRRGGTMLMSVEEENAGEDFVGPGNTSAQQWDSWFAVFGPRGAGDGGNDGTVVSPYEAKTGRIDAGVVEGYKAYDIGLKLRNKPGEMGPLLRERVRLVVGDKDNFYLNEAVALLGRDLGRVYPPRAPERELGYIEVLAGLDHGTVLQSKRVKGFAGEMVEWLERVGLAEKRANDEKDEKQKKDEKQEGGAEGKGAGR